MQNPIRLCTYDCRCEVLSYTFSCAIYINMYVSYLTWTWYKVKTKLLYEYLIAVPNSKASQCCIFAKDFNHQWFCRFHNNECSITSFDRFRFRFQDFPGPFVHFLKDFFKLAANLGCSTVHYRWIAFTDEGWMVKDDHLSIKCKCLLPLLNWKKERF